MLLLNHPSCLIDSRSLGGILYGVCFFSCVGGFFTFPIFSHRPKTHWLETLNCIWVWGNGVCVHWLAGDLVQLCVPPSDCWGRFLPLTINATAQKWSFSRYLLSLSSVLVYVHELHWHVWLCMMQNRIHTFLNKTGRVLLRNSALLCFLERLKFVTKAFKVYLQW